LITLFPGYVFDSYWADTQYWYGFWNCWIPGVILCTWNFLCSCLKTVKRNRRFKNFTL